MSIQAVDIVLRAPIRPPALKLTALVMAYAHNGKTGLLNPSLAFIAGQVGIDRRQVQRYVRTLIDLQLISVIANALGGKPGTTPHYRMHLDRISALVVTDVAEDTPTGGADVTGRGGADVTPEAAMTGGADDADGWCTRRGRVVPMTRTGGVGTTLTGMEPEGTGREPGSAEPTQLDAFDTATPAVAGSHPPAASSSSLKGERKAKPKAEAKSAATWEAYRQAYLSRYGAEPLRDAPVNSQLARFVDKVGAEKAPVLAAFYVDHPGQYYAQRMHPVDLLLKDCSKLHTEWVTRSLAPQAGASEPAFMQDRRARTAAFAGHAAAKPNRLAAANAEVARSFMEKEGRGRTLRTFSGNDYSEGVTDGHVVDL